MFVQRYALSFILLPAPPPVFLCFPARPWAGKQLFNTTSTNSLWRRRPKKSKPQRNDPTRQSNSSGMDLGSESESRLSGRDRRLTQVRHIRSSTGTTQTGSITRTQRAENFNQTESQSCDSSLFNFPRLFIFSTAEGEASIQSSWAVWLSHF